MPVGEINVENDGWIRADGIQTDYKEDDTGHYIEITAFLSAGQDGLIGKLFDRVMSRKEIKSLRIRIQQSAAKTLHFEFSGCKPVSGSWQQGKSGWATFRCYKVGALVSMGGAPQHPANPRVPSNNHGLSPIALGLLSEVNRGKSRG